MTWSFHPEARDELIQSIDYYEEQQRALGFDFSREVYKTIRRIINHPLSWPFISTSVRKILVHRYPFAVLYHYDSGTTHIYIIAVMHLRRKPDYWKERI